MPKFKGVNAHATNNYTITTCSLTQYDLLHGQPFNGVCDDERAAAVAAELNGFASVTWQWVDEALGETLSTGGEATLTLTGGAVQNVAVAAGVKRVFVDSSGLLPSIGGIACAGGNVDGRCITFVARSGGFGFNSQDGGSTAANRLVVDTVGGLLQGSGAARTLRYRAADSRWYLD